jgi:NADP-dependent 3-hydroxy acid dehydrogenase YdfG
MNLQDKNALVTGAAGGIGQAVAVELARHGAQLSLVDINESGLEETLEQVEALGRRCLTIRADVADKGQVQHAAEAAIKEYGHLDLLVNNAGVTLIGEVGDYTIEDWEWIVGINLWGTIYGLHYVLPHMIERKSGHIVNVASAAGLIAMPANAAYCATKFGIVGLSEVLRAELARHNIGVTVICPAGIVTEFEKNARVKGWSKFKPGNFVKSYGRTPEGVAKKIVSAIEKDKFLVIIGAEARLLYAIKRFFPRLYYRIGVIMARRLEHFR